jgi:hypothetical protein
MARLTVEQDMKLGAALDQLEDAIEAAYATLKMVQWAQINVARYAGGVVSPKLNAEIRTTALDIERLWDLARTRLKNTADETDALQEFVEHHNHKILDIIVRHED